MLLIVSLAVVLLIECCRAAPGRRAQICNGHADLCPRRYSNVTFIGSHDSFAFSANPLALARDQEVNITTQLNLGVRLLQAQSHEWLLFDGGPVVTYLKHVKAFLEANPNEVLTLLFTNPEGVDIVTVWKHAFDKAGMTPFAYVPPTVPMAYSDWPTLSEMIDSGKRVVVFLDTGANTTLVDFILPEFEMIWETPFSVTNASFPCSIDRAQGPLPIQDHMYMINHSLNKNIFDSGIIVTDPYDAATTNGVPSIIDHANRCSPLGAGRAPSFVLLDFVNIGQGFEAAEELNKLHPQNATTVDNNAASHIKAPTASLANVREDTLRKWEIEVARLEQRANEWKVHADKWKVQADEWEVQADEWEKQVGERKVQAEEWKVQAEEWKVQAEEWKVQAEEWKVQAEEWKVQAEEWKVQAEEWKVQAEEWKVQADDWEKQVGERKEQAEEWKEQAEEWEKQADERKEQADGWKEQADEWKERAGRWEHRSNNFEQEWKEKQEQKETELERAGVYWADFVGARCVSSKHREYHARLLNLTPNISARDACNSTPATINGITYASPAYCDAEVINNIPPTD
ncbi:hypothetical protein DXG01_010337 [Tephrocybe rancida]|nr:hypothetical protein DXG01_010337 [Tephrocybe rancida]